MCECVNLALFRYGSECRFGGGGGRLSLLHLVPNDYSGYGAQSGQAVSHRAAEPEPDHRRKPNDAESPQARPADMEG